MLKRSASRLPEDIFLCKETKLRSLALIPFEPRLAAFLRRWMKLQSETLALVAPGDLVAVLHDMFEAVGADCLRALVVALKGLDIACHGPHH